MEKRMLPAVRAILQNYPRFKSLELNGFNGVRTRYSTPEHKMDILGIDLLLNLTTGNGPLTVQFKCSTKENLERWGMERRSLVLGDANDFDINRYEDTHINQVDLILTGYEVEPGCLSPFALVRYPLVIKRYYSGRLNLVHERHRSRSFVWCRHDDLMRANVIAMHDFKCWKDVD